MTAVDHAELKRDSRAPLPPDILADAIGRIWTDEVIEVGERLIHGDNLIAMAVERLRAHTALLSEIEVLKAERDVLKVERLGLRAAIFGSHDYDPALRHASFIEMARLTEDARKGALSRAVEAERQLAALMSESEGLRARIKCLEKLGGEQSLRVMEQATRAKDAENALVALRTQAPDGVEEWTSWLEFYDYAPKEIIAWLRSLRPQTAESGK